MACVVSGPEATPDASLKDSSTDDAGTRVDPAPCYSDGECGERRCLHAQPFVLAWLWNDPSDLDWAPADVVAGYATLYNNHVDFRVRFRDTPFDPIRSQTLRVCLDTDAD